MKIVVSILGGIGDILLLTPIFRVIKTQYKDCEITVLTNYVGKQILEGLETVDEVCVFKKNRNFISLIYKFWKYDYAFLIDLSRRPALIAFLARITNIVGVAHKRGKYLTKIIEKENTNFYEPYNKAEIFQASDLKIDFEKTDLTKLEIGKANESDYAYISKILNSMNFVDKQFIVVAPFSSWREKDWQLSKYISLVEKLTQAGKKVVVIGSKVNEEDVRNKLNFINCLNLVGKTTITQLMVVIEKARLVVTSCSGQLHIAGALGTFSLAIYGPTDSRRWAPKHKCKVVKLPLSCIPCDNDKDLSKCKNKLCYEDISVNSILQEIVTIERNIDNENIL